MPLDYKAITSSQVLVKVFLLNTITVLFKLMHCIEALSYIINSCYFSGGIHMRLIKNYAIINEQKMVNKRASYTNLDTCNVVLMGGL